MFFDKLLHKFKTDDFSVNNQDNVVQIDPYFYDVAMLCIDKNKASVDLLQKYSKSIPVMLSNCSSQGDN